MGNTKTNQLRTPENTGLIYTKRQSGNEKWEETQLGKIGADETERSKTEYNNLRH